MRTEVNATEGVRVSFLTTEKWKKATRVTTMGEAFLSYRKSGGVDMEGKFDHQIPFQRTFPEANLRLTFLDVQIKKERTSMI
jgi:hypothetical protein